MPVTMITSSSDFKRAIAQNKLVVVDFYALWCGPCKAIAPKFETFSNTYSQANFIKVNVDDLNEVATSCGIKAMPTFQLYRSGKMLAEIVGANVYQLEAKIKQHINAGLPAGFEGKGHVLGSGDVVNGGSTSSQSTTNPAPQPQGNDTQIYIYILLAILLAYWLFSGSSGHDSGDISW